MESEQLAPSTTEAATGTGRDEEFPILRDWTYLDNATFGPLPRAHSAALAATAARMSAERIGDVGAASALESLRADTARLLGCGPDSLAMLKSTGEGVGLVAAGLDWRPGDEVILYEREFPGTVAGWLNLRQRGVRIRVIADHGRARFGTGDVAALINDRTRAVCVSLVNSDHGLRAPVEGIAALCRPRGIWLVVDAVQAIGVLDIDVPGLGADIVAAHGYKFLLSGFGIAPVYCSPRAIGELRVPLAGWKNAPGARAGQAGELAFGESARRFESTLPSVASMAGMRESVRLLARAGRRATQQRVLSLLELLADGLAAKGYEVISSRGPAERSALLAARHPGIDTAELHGALQAARIACAVRGGALRFSPHLYNRPADIDRLLGVLPG